MNVPPLLTSATTALDNGFAQLNKAAAELTAPLDTSPPTDSVDVRNASAIDPTIAGIQDLALAQEQVGAGALLLHVYGSDRQRLFDLLNDSGTDRPAA